jgi:hypothetical protein
MESGEQVFGLLSEGFAVARGPAGPDQKSVTGAGIEQ